MCTRCGSVREVAMRGRRCRNLETRLGAHTVTRRETWTAAARIRDSVCVVGLSAEQVQGGGHRGGRLAGPSGGLCGREEGDRGLIFGDARRQQQAVRPKYMHTIYWTLNNNISHSRPQVTERKPAPRSLNPLSHNRRPRSRLSPHRHHLANSFVPLRALDNLPRATLCPRTLDLRNKL